MARIVGWSRLRRAELFGRWVENFGSTEEALAHAIWVANRLVKTNRFKTRDEFYSLKDHWLRLHQHCLVEGRVAREEVQYCYACNGTGACNCDEGWWYDHICYRCGATGECDRCFGDGIYSTSILYEHRLVVRGQAYSFHSYVRPSILASEPGLDCESYGGCFSKEELKELALPLTGLMRLLRHVAVHCWQLRFSRLTRKWIEVQSPSQADKVGIELPAARYAN